MKAERTPRTTLILHGHFYQPPRENPRTGIIDIQDTATPYDDWNENIWACCYRANAHSRYLAGSQIACIRNNYAYISFNFGPTLLSWISEHHPETLERIIEADKDSVERLGHGNAIAQGYNHTILPLDRPEDAEMEIVWGLNVFRSWFGRDSEGFWCPECAINPTVVDLLAKHGVKFVILSPWQAESVENEKGEMVALGDKPAPTDRPFILTGPKGGQIAAFFYDPDLASGISFGHFLRNADTLYDTLLKSKQATGVSLIHAATDGEVYGHHEPYGDMALAALVQKVIEHDDFTFSNYGAYLAEHPAMLHATLRPGEDGKGCSWSCSHGVSRWYKDCGCHTGGEDSWNQKWRTPMRDAFNLAHASVMSFAKKKITEITGEEEPYKVLYRFASVPSLQETMPEYIDGLHKRYDFPETEDITLARVSEMVLFSMYSFTSCGWFFNDISGIEPRQDIAYALHSMELLSSLGGEDVLPSFLKIMSEAKCNVPAGMTGKDIAEEEASRKAGTLEALQYFWYATKFTVSGKLRWGRFTLESSNGETFRIKDTYGSTYLGTVKEAKSTKRTLWMETEDTANGKPAITVIRRDSFTPKMRSVLSALASTSLNIFTRSQCQQLADTLDNYQDFAKTSKYVATDKVESKAIGLSFSALGSLIRSGTFIENMDEKNPFMRITRFLARYQRSAEKKRTQEYMDVFLDGVCGYLEKEGKEGNVPDSFLCALTAFIHSVSSYGVDISLTRLQETCYPFFLSKKLTPAMKALSDELNFSEVLVRA